MAKLKGGKVGSIKALKQKLKKGSGGGQFLTRVPSDGSITGRFLEEPENWIEYFEHYDASRSGSYSFPCIENCPESHDGDDKPKKRYLTNFVDTTENKVVPLVLPASAASSLVKKFDKNGTLLDRDYEISRTGTGFDTEYDVDAEPVTKMNLSRYEPLDLIALLEAQLEDGETEEEDEDETPKSKKGTKGKRKPAPIDTDDDEEDDDDSDDDDEDDSPPRRKVAKKKAAPKRTASKPAAKKAPAKKSIRKIKR